MNRYARQICLPEVGAEGQARLRAAHVVVIGAGGLGAPVLQYLCAAGIGSVLVVDPDRISRSNLHRQVLFREQQIGALKAVVAVDTLAALNPECDIRAMSDALDPGNVKEVVQGADIVVDCADSFAVSYMLSDHCKAAGLALITASALGLQGYVGGFCANAPSLRAVFPDLPARAATCATVGVLGPVVGTVGALQAQMMLAHLLRLQPAVMGLMVTVDLAQYRFGGFRFDGAVEPEGALFSFITADAVTARDFAVELRDVAVAPELFAPGALRYRVAEFVNMPPIPDPGQRAVLCCRSGLRAWQAATALRQHWSGPVALVAMGQGPGGG
jgi:sulfur-carrier protein adenylyltransferase/sulfurtransferase